MGTASGAYMEVSPSSGEAKDTAANGPTDRGRAEISDEPSRARLRLRKVEGLPIAAWSLLSLDDGILVGTAFGIYFVPNDGAPRLVPGSESVGTAYNLTRSVDPRRIWVGGDQGLSSLRREADGWRYLSPSFGPKEEVLARVLLHVIEQANFHGAILP